MVEISPTSAEACEYLRDRLLSKLNLPVTPWPDDARGRRLYIGRREVQNTRKLINAIEIEQRYLAAGFEIIYPEDYTLDEQICIFNSATNIAGPHGSAFVNIIFCRPGTRVSVFSHQHGANFAAWAAAATALGLEHLYVVGEGIVDSSWHIHHYDYAIPSVLIDESLKYHA
jgi:capsular polysaccharide biosynthesis protein